MILSCYEKGPKNAPVLVLLHGFLGSNTDWKELIKLLENDFRLLSIDLPGHGSSPWRANHGFKGFSQALEQTLEQQAVYSFSLLGYSLGGRLAIVYASTYPHRVERLILESTNPGLVTLKEREQRHRSDLYWARCFCQQPLAEVLDKWYRQSVFSDLSKQQVKDLIHQRMRGNGHRLAKAMMAFSLSRQPDYRAELSRLRNTIPIHYLHGANDHKFAALAQQLLARQQVNSVHSVLGAGHNAHWQQPTMIAQLLRAFIPSTTI